MRAWNIHNGLVRPDPTEGNRLADDFTKWADWVREQVEPKLAKVFPADNGGRRPAVYFWARTMVCPNPSCRAEIPLLSSYWLANSTRRTVWVDVDSRPGRIDLKVRTTAPPAHLNLSDGTVKSSSVTCPAQGCGTSTKAKEVRDYAKRTGFRRRLYAVLDIDGRERTYRAPRPEEIEGAEALVAVLLSELEDSPDGTSALPDEPITKSQFRILRSLVYGIDTFRGLFNDRQLCVLGALCEAVRTAHEEMLAEGMDPERALAVTTYLGLCVDRIADYNSSFMRMAYRARRVVRNTFPQQAIRMAWDYIGDRPVLPRVREAGKRGPVDRTCDPSLLRLQRSTGNGAARRRAEPHIPRCNLRRGGRRSAVLRRLPIRRSLRLLLCLAEAEYRTSVPGAVCHAP